MTRLFVFVLIGFLAICVNGKDKECSLQEKESLRRLGTKTPYRVIANKKDSPIEYKGCTLVKIHGVIRHGTRTPGIKAVNEIKETLNVIKDQINDNSFQSGECLASEESFEKWKLNVENDGEKFLTHEGEDEMIDLAERFSNRFPSLLNRDYDNSSFYFRFTDTQRTKESAKHFAIGLFGKKNSKYVWYPEPLGADPILRFYKLCDKWRKEVKKSKAANEQRDKYMQSDEAFQSLKRLTEKLGINNTLKYDEAQAMYITCSFETAWNKHKKSPWCSVFGNDDIKVFEYGEELKYYWRDGYGFDINYKQACPLIDDIFSRFKSDDDQKAVFYFTHSGTILKLLSHLGLYKDDFRLMHDTTKQLKDKRRWRVSLIDSFSSNVLFALYKCNDDYKVLTMHQERIIKVPGCPEKGLCPIEIMEKTLSESLEHCDFNNMCAYKL